MPTQKKTPAKKTVTQVIKKPIIKKDQALENQKGINALKRGVGKKEDLIVPDPIINEEPEIKDEIEIEDETEAELNPVIKNEPEIKNEISEEPKITPLSIWSDIKKATEEDKNIKDPQEVSGKVENIADDLNSAVNGINDDNEANDKKQGNKVKAGIVIELVDVGFMLVCNLITWDFSDDNQKRYSLHPDRKKALQSNLFNLYQLSDKKPNPKKDIIFLMLGSYSPMLIVAVITLIKNLKAKTAAKKNEKIVNQQNVEFERQKKQLEIDRFRLEQEIKYHNEQLDHQSRLKSQPRATTDSPFKGVPKIGKQTPPKALKRVSGTSTRGVAKGVKRGPYKKK